MLREEGKQYSFHSMLYKYSFHSMLYNKIPEDHLLRQSGDGSLIDIYFGSIGKSIREPSPD